MTEKTTVKYNSSLLREHNLEHDEMLASGVELNLRNDLHSKNICKWVNAGFDNAGNPIIHGGHTKIFPNSPYTYTTLGTINVQQSCNPQVTQYTDHGPLMVNDNPMLKNSKFFVLRLMHSSQNLPANAYAPWSQADKYYAAYFGNQMGISGSWDATIENSGPWIRSQIFSILDSNINSFYLPVADVKGVILFFIKVIVFRDSMSYMVLPVAYYQNPNYYALLGLSIPPEPPYHLLGVHSLREFPDADIYVTDDFVLYINNPATPERIFLFNPGSDAWIKKLHIEPLHKKRVILPVWEKDKKSFQTAMVLTEKLYSEDITPYFGILKSTPYIQSQPEQALSATSVVMPVQNQLLSPAVVLEQFLMGVNDHECEIIDVRNSLTLAKAIGVNIADEIKFDRNGAIDMEEFEEPMPLIKNIAESGAITAIIEHRGVEPDIISGLLMSSLQNNENKHAAHLKNLCGETVRSITFIDAEHQARYMRHIKALPNNLNPIPNSGSLLYKANFLDEPLEDGFITFKNALRESLAQVVIFDVESICEANHRKLSLLKKVFRHCKEKDIAVILILRNGKILQYFSSPDRMVHIWKKAGDKFNYIVEPEARLGEKEIRPFEINITTDKCITKSLKPEILGKIPERENRNKQPGVAPAMEAFLEKLGPQNIKDMPLS